MSLFCWPFFGQIVYVLGVRRSSVWRPNMAPQTADVPHCRRAALRRRHGLTINVSHMDWFILDDKCPTMTLCFTQPGMQHFHCSLVGYVQSAAKYALALSRERRYFSHLVPPSWYRFLLFTPFCYLGLWYIPSCNDALHFLEFLMGLRRHHSQSSDGGLAVEFPTWFHSMTMTDFREKHKAWRMKFFFR